MTFYRKCLNGGKVCAERINSAEAYYALLDGWNQRKNIFSLREMEQKKIARQNELGLSDEEVKSDEVWKNLDAEQGKIKRQLVSCFFACHPKPDGTVKEAKKQNLCFYEFDQIADRIDKVVKRILKYQKWIRPVLIYKSSRGHGIHVIAEPNKRYTYEAQQSIAEAIIGEVIDKSVKNLNREAYQSIKEDILYIDEEKLFSEENVMNKDWQYDDCTGEDWYDSIKPYLSMLEVVRNEKLNEFNTQEQVTEVTSTPVISQVVAPVQVNYPMDYKGTPFAYIIDELVCHFGGWPTEGDRHATMMKVIPFIAPLCEYNVDWLFQVVPHFGKPEEELKAAIKYVVEENLNNPKPLTEQNSVMMKVLCNVRKGDWTVKPELPQKLPSLVELFVKGAPERIKPSIATCIFPPLSTFLNGKVSFKSVNGKYYAPCMMSVLVGEMNSGKSHIEDALNAILRTIQDSDRVYKAQYKAWVQSQKKKSKNEGQDPEPQGCQQIVPTDATRAAFLKLAMKAEENENKALYMYADEIAYLCKMFGNQRYLPSDLIRAAYNHSIWGASRVSVDAVNGEAKLNYHFNTSTTPTDLLKYVTSDMVNDGTANRMYYTYLEPRTYDEEEIFDCPDEDEIQEALQPYLQRLKAANGKIMCEEVLKFTKKLEKTNIQRANACGSTAALQLLGRSIPNAFHKAMLLYIAEGEWNHEIADFVEYTLDMDMYCKVRFFADKVQSEDTTAHEKSRGSNTILKFLPCEFTREDFDRCCAEHGCKNATQMICNYKRDKLVEQREDGKYIKKIA